MQDILEHTQWEQSGRGRALRAALRLFAAMMALTLLARGLAGVSMPRVTVTHPYPAAVTGSIRKQALITPGDGLPFSLPAGILVEEVYVRSGGMVQAGDALLRLSLAELEQRQAEMRAELALLEVQYRQGCAPQQADPFAVGQAQAALLRAYDECHEAYAKGEELQDKARRALDEAYAAGDAGAVRQAQAGLEAAEEQAEQQNKAALAAAQAAEDRRNAEVHSYLKEAEALGKAGELSRAQAAVTLAALAEKRRQLDLLDELIQSGGVFRAPEDGTVTRMDCAAGGQSPAVGGLLAGAEQPCVLTFTLDRAEAELAPAGTALTVRQGTKEAQAKMDAVSAPDENGNVQVSVYLQQDGWRAGSAEAELRLNGGSWPHCLPLSAVQTDGSGQFAYKLEPRATVLGVQDVTVRVPLTVERTGDDIAAVSGALDRGDRIVSGSDKPLQGGVRVRIDEG